MINRWQKHDAYPQLRIDKISLKIQQKDRAKFWIRIAGGNMAKKCEVSGSR